MSRCGLGVLVSVIGFLITFGFGAKTLADLGILARWRRSIGDTAAAGVELGRRAWRKVLQRPVPTRIVTGTASGSGGGSGTARLIVTSTRQKGESIEDFVNRVAQARADEVERAARRWDDEIRAEVADQAERLQNLVEAQEARTDDLRQTVSGDALATVLGTAIIALGFLLGLGC